MKNLGLKVFSLFLALALSYYVNSETNISVIGFNVPVEIKNVPEGKMLVWPLSPRIQVTLRGPSYLVSQVATSNLTYKLPLPDGVNGSYRAEVKKEQLSIPASLEIVSIDPAQLDITLDHKISKELPVVVPRYGSLPDDIKLASMEVSPATVVVSGPESSLKGINALETEPIDFRGLRNDFSQRLILRSPGNLVSVPTDHVDFKIQLQVVESDTAKKAAVVTKKK